MQHFYAVTKAQARQRGFSLVEIMVAITLSLIVLAGVVAVMYSSKVIYLENERVGRIQENGRAALELILRDLRGAGFPGCAQPIDGLFEMNNVLADPTSVAWNLAQPTYGFEGTGGTWEPALDTTLIPDAIPDNDIIVVRTIPAGAPSMRVSAVVNPTDSISVEKGAGEILTEGMPAIISDCGNASIFVVSDFTDDDETAEIDRTTIGGPPTNSTTNLGATFAPGARVSPITSIVYYVAPSADGTGPALWRVVSNNPPQEIVPGVEALQIRYGVDTGSDPEVTVDEYVNADEVTDWSNVISVTLALLARSAEENSQTIDSREYTLLETVLEPFNDRFQRSLFTTTVTLRNRTT
jgi:type IV pilus assembly protein PilW